MFLWHAKAWLSKAWPLQILHLPRNESDDRDFGYPPARTARLTEIRTITCWWHTIQTSFQQSWWVNSSRTCSLNRASWNHWRREFTACRGSVGNVLNNRAGSYGMDSLDRPVLGNSGGKYCHLQKIRAPHLWRRINLWLLFSWCCTINTVDN